MTAVLTVTCDRCGERIDFGRSVLSVEAGPAPPSWPTATASGRPALDLCGSCLDALGEWMRHGHHDAQDGSERDVESTVV